MNQTMLELHSISRKILRNKRIMRLQWEKTKHGLLVKQLKHMEHDDPGKLAIIVDAGDVVFGGCSEKDLTALYNGIVEASNGAKIVASAEVSPYPMQAMLYYNETYFTWLA